MHERRCVHTLDKLVREQVLSWDTVWDIDSNSPLL